MNIITNVWLFPLNWLYLAQDSKLKWILENFLIVSVWLRISCSNSRIRRVLIGLLVFTLSSAIAALEARLVVVRLGAEDQALDGDQHLGEWEAMHKELTLKEAELKRETNLNDGRGLGIPSLSLSTLPSSKQWKTHLVKVKEAPFYFQKSL